MMNATLAKILHPRTLVVVLGLVLAGLVASSIIRHPSNAPQAKPITQATSTSTVATAATSTPDADDDDDAPPGDAKSFQAAADILTGLVNQKTPTAAFAELKTMTANDPKLAVQCHALTHVIGNAAYAKYGSFKAAFAYNDYMCGSGYIHSLVSNTFKDTPDPTTILNTICAGQDGYCYHGIGHGLMFVTDLDVPKALDLCQDLDTTEHQTRCSEGVFMQNFEVGGDDPQPYLFKDDPLKECRDEPRFKTACYLYAGEYLAIGWKQTPDVFSLCDQSEPAYEARCVTGIGAYLMAVNLQQPKTAELVCDKTGDVGLKNACIDGMVSYHLVNFNSIPKTAALCASMAAADQSACNASLASRKAFYE